MILIDNVDTFGWENAVRGTRNAFNSWDKSDSHMDGRTFVIGEDDLALLKKLANAGSDHGKFLRMIHVQADVTAPVYFMQELATYKIGTTMNSTSLQHTGARRDFTIRDFSVPDNRMYDILDPPIRDFKSENPIIYPYETDEYRDYITESGRKYKVFRNGRIFSYPFEYVDSYGTGRHRTFEEREISPYQNNGGYWVVRIGGRPGEHIQLHRLIAKVWLGDRSNEGLEVNHKNKNRGDCSVENLEWLTHQENNIHKHETYETPIWTKYKKHLLSTKYPSYKKNEIRDDLKKMTYSEVAKKHGCSMSLLEDISLGYSYSLGKEYGELFNCCDIWHEMISYINYYRNLYVETGDYSNFIAMRQLMPMGYNYTVTWDANYAVLRNIYHARRNHKLSEWKDFCCWIESLPYAKELIAGGKDAE